jgi:hypothetical protein
VTLAVLLVLATEPLMPPPAPECGRDDDCIVSTFGGCCGSCCPAAPEAVSRAIDQSQRSHCRAVDCAPRRCSNLNCEKVPPASAYRAVCENRQCKLAPARGGDSPQCSSDDDCLVANFGGCCGSCCPPAPFVISRQQVKAHDERCVVTDCGPPRCGGSCPAVEPVSAFRALCDDHQCKLAPATAHGQCARDSDCRVEYRGDPSCQQSPCGCCPGAGEAIAVSASSPPLMPPPRPLAKKEGSPAFGLSQGNGQPPPPPPQCSPCPSPRPVRAACREQRCVIEWLHR